MENQIDKEHITQVALKLLNQSGINSLSMRKLAEQLGIKASSIYWHVQSKSELLQLLADKITEMVPYPEEDIMWENGLYYIAKKYREVLLSYRDSAEIMMITQPFSPNRLTLIDYVFSLFIKAGLPLEDISSAGSLYNNYILAFVMDEVKMSQQESVNDGNNQFSSLDSKRYPSLNLINASSNEFNMDHRFHFGLEILIEGYKARK